MTRPRRLASPVLLATLVLAAAGEDPRSSELLRYECTTDLTSKHLTLFANGTVRLHLSDKDGDDMSLGELTPDELAAYVARLRREDLEEAESSRFGPVGEWVEQCELVLALDGEPTRAFRFGRFDSLSLGLSRVLGIVAELEQAVVERGPTDGLPVGYSPLPGDVLERSDGVRFEVVTVLRDSLQVELRGIDSPLVAYVPLAELNGLFPKLVERRGGR